MQIKTKAIVLRAQDYNENDKLLTLLTEKRGLVFAYVFGARKMKSRLSSVCSMLSYGEFVLFENKGKYNVDSAESERLFFGIRPDLDKLSYASYSCLLCSGIIPAEEPAEDMLRLLLNTLHMLENRKLPAQQLKAIFELRAMCITGYAPNLVACSECGRYDKDMFWFNLEQGCVTCMDCKPEGDAQYDMPMQKAVFLAARHIVYAPAEKLFSFRLGEKAAEELSFITEKYTALQTDKKYPTLEFLNSSKDIFKQPFFGTKEVEK